MAPVPDLCGDAVCAIVSLISPLEYCVDFRPYFTLYDPDFAQITALMDARFGTHTRSPRLPVKSPKPFPHSPSAAPMSGLRAVSAPEPMLLSEAGAAASAPDAVRMAPSSGSAFSVRTTPTASACTPLPPAAAGTSAASPAVYLPGVGGSSRAMGGVAHATISPAPVLHVRATASTASPGASVHSAGTSAAASADAVMSPQPAMDASILRHNPGWRWMR
ncbi:hypothetical protein EON68_03010, partial [archaeon]